MSDDALIIMAGVLTLGLLALQAFLWWDESRQPSKKRDWPDW